MLKTLVLISLITLVNIRDTNAVRELNILKSLKQRGLNCHNLYRYRHGAPLLISETELNQYAQRWAKKLAKDGKGLVHSTGPYGESLFAGGRSDTPYHACKSWYSENTKYTYGQPTPKNIKQVGHFTQMIWKSTKRLGIGMARSKRGRIYIVASYKPQGNVRGQFDKNVKKP